MNNKQLRQTAFIVKIGDLRNGRYVKEDGWDPNYILTKKAKISRANIMGVVISKSENPDLSYKSIIIDDGSGSIAVRLFENSNLFEGVGIGDVVLLIGRPREYGSEKYVVPEIIRKIDNESWLNYRKRELEIFDRKNKVLEEPEVVEEEKINVQEAEKLIKQETMSDKIIGTIRKLDSGEGADIEDVIKESKSGDAENIISMLLKQGEIFELRPGKLKII